MNRYYLLLLPLLFLATSCYEDRIACLDPDASNFDLRADEACTDDCCTYPNLTLQVTRKWGEETFVTNGIYMDAAGNEFTIVRLRFYLGDMEIVVNDRLLPTPENLIEIGRFEGGDTVTTDLNANLVLLTTNNASATVGTYRGGGQAVTALEGTLGLPTEYSSFAPSTAPASSPLATQPGLLNLRDGQGYLQASLEFSIVGRGDTTRSNVYGRQNFTLELPQPILPLRGSRLNLLLDLDYQTVFEGVDLLSNPSDFARRLIPAMTLTGAN